METTLIRELYGYHHWANRRLVEVAQGLGAEAAARDMGKHWSFPTLTRMFGHIYGADWLWLQRFKGVSPTSMPGETLRRSTPFGRPGTRSRLSNAPTSRGSQMQTSGAS